MIGLLSLPTAQPEHFRASPAGFPSPQGSTLYADLGASITAFVVFSLASGLAQWYVATLQIHKRLEQVMGQRIDALTADIDDPALRADTAEALQKIKLVSLPGLWRNQRHLNQAEYDELEHLMLSSRLIPSPERQR